MTSSDIIVAPATAVGSGAIAIIRISGDNCLDLVFPFMRISSDIVESHRFYYGLFTDRDNVVDEVMFVFMASPRTFTAEDTVEVHCHNNRFIVEKIIDVIVAAGARIADPGEFTRRAYLNGRIDLARAEAVADLINAQSSSAARIAVEQLTGKLSQIIFKYRDLLLEMLSLVEAYVDFPEDDFELPHISLLSDKGYNLKEKLSNVIASFDEGRMVKDGLSVVILGKPNVGKSSILNRILGTERAIVTDIPGTTRDIIEESIILHGVVLRFADTAGIRSTYDIVERDGVQRALNKLSSSDLVLYVVDSDNCLSIPDFLSGPEAPPFIVVVNKIDLYSDVSTEQKFPFPIVRVSAKTGTGFAGLYDEIGKVLAVGNSGSCESFMLSDRRHRSALISCSNAVDEFLVELDSCVSPEFLALYLRDALQALGQITGETTPDDVLNSIFSRFCIGK